MDLVKCGDCFYLRPIKEEELMLVHPEKRCKVAGFCDIFNKPIFFAADGTEAEHCQQCLKTFQAMKEDE